MYFTSLCVTFVRSKTSEILIKRSNCLNFPQLIKCMQPYWMPKFAFLYDLQHSHKNKTDQEKKTILW